MKTIVQTLFVAACIFFSACGDDSGNNAESSGEGSANRAADLDDRKLEIRCGGKL